MSFLAPLFLAGTLAVALPVVFHLIRRQTQTPKVFSSLRFLEASPPVMVQRKRIEDVLLLLLRCLALIAVAAGFARPFLEQALPILPSDRAGVRKVILLDRSASMRREGLWTEAVRRAEAAVASAGEGDEVALGVFDRSLRPLVGFEQWRAALPGDRRLLATTALGGERPGWEGTALGKALVGAAEWFEQEAAQGAGAKRRQIVVVTDMQQGSRLEALQGFEWPKGIEVAFEIVEARDPSNAALQWLAESSTVHGREPRARLRVRNAVGSTREQFQVTVASGGGTNRIEIYVPPGQNRVVDAPKLEGDTGVGRLVLSGDAADFDNSVHVIRPVMEAVRVAYVGAEAAQDSSGPLFYLAKALAQSELPRVEILTNRSAVEAALAVPVGLAWVVVADAAGGGMMPRLRSYVEAGGQVLWLAREGDDGRVLAELVPGGKLALSEAPVVNYFMMTTVDYQHPLFKPFAEAQFSDFTKLYFWKHRRVMDLPADGVRVAARFDDGDPAIAEWSLGRGRVVLFATTWAPKDSQLARSTKFVPFVFSFLDQAGRLEVRGGQYLVGDAVELPDGGGRGTVEKPDRSRAAIGPGEKTYGGTTEPGIYRWSDGQRSYVFAVNLDPMEGRTEPLPVEELGKLGVPLKHAELEADAAAAARQQSLSRQMSESEQRFWRVCLVLGLALLLIETALSTWVSARRLRLETL